MKTSCAGPAASTRGSLWVLGLGMRHFNNGTLRSGEGGEGRGGALMKCREGREGNSCFGVLLRCHEYLYLKA